MDVKGIGPLVNMVEFVTFFFTSSLPYSIITINSSFTHTIYSAITHTQLISLTDTLLSDSFVYSTLLQAMHPQVYKPGVYLVDSLARTWFIIALKPV